MGYLEESLYQGGGQIEDHILQQVLCQKKCSGFFVCLLENNLYIFTTPAPPN